MRLGQPCTAGMVVTITLALALLAPAMTRAEAPTLPDGPGQEVVEMEWSFLAAARGSQQFQTSIDGGGDVAVSETWLGVVGRLRMSPALSLRIRLGYEHAAYDFSGSEGFGGLDPWEEVHTIGLASTLSARIGDDWRGYAGFRVKASGESGADFGRAITVGGLAGASYRVTGRLTIGAGFSISQRLEDSPSVSPVLNVVWAILDNLTLKVGPAAEGAEGVGGLELEWQALPVLELAIGTRDQRRRFRLNDRGVAPAGVGGDRSRPIYAGARWRIAPNADLSMMAGVAVNGELRLEDRHGHGVRDEVYDAAPFASLHLAVRF